MLNILVKSNNYSNEMKTQFVTKYEIKLIFLNSYFIAYKMFMLLSTVCID